MDAVRLIQSLERTGAFLASLTADLPGEVAGWRPAEGAWSITEIACHLLDEEREDFRPRIRSTLDDPRAEWPAIDPEGWVTARDYAARNLATIRGELLQEREASLAWLRGLGSVDWTATYVHPALGPLRAGDLLASWASHDLLHLRQIVRRLHERLQADSTPFESAYAGPW